MTTERIIPGEIRIFLNHIYEFKKGVRNMVLYTIDVYKRQVGLSSSLLQEVVVNANPNIRAAT